MNENISVVSQPLFYSFFIGGFECSTHVSRGGKRHDLIDSTQHDRFIHQDYERLKSVGIQTAREGFRWHLIEETRGVYDFSSAIPMICAAREQGIKVIWDLLHFGWPDHINVFSPEFPERFAAFAQAAIRVLESEGESVPYVCPINEISFLSWSGGDGGFFNPFVQGRGDEIKRQLASAAIEAAKIALQTNAQTRLFHIDPIINIVADITRPHERLLAENYRQSQFQVWDMISGRMNPELGGDPKYLDVIGVNYYSNNQWIHEGATLGPSSPYYTRLRYMLREVWLRYGRPLFISETGIENEARAPWLRYIGGEVRAAKKLGVPVEGVCLYPILNHPGWDDDRHCLNGLWDYADEQGNREIYEPLVQEMAHQLELLAQGDDAPDETETLDIHALDEAASAMEEATQHGRELESA